MTSRTAHSEDYAAEADIGPTSIDEAMRELRRLPRVQWLDLARSDQSHRWRHGIGVPVEDYFQHLPEIHADVEEAVVLISGEVQLRREQGESPAVSDFQRRFPEFADRILMQFHVDQFLTAADEEAADNHSSALRDIELPGYEFLERLGSGASGVVYRARQLGLERFVAIKVFSIAGADAKQLARQRQEAEILAKLHHPNVVHIYEVREHLGCLHLVMEYVEGSTLADRARERLLAPEESARLVLILAETAEAVHAAGILHRDLKPSNVLVTTTGELKITDFGLAKLQSSSTLLTTSDSVLGTPSYMAPEQAVGNAHLVGPQADVYSLGAILYELVTGRAPFLGATVLDTLSLIRNQEPVPPRKLQLYLPRDLETICLKCLEKSPTVRYPTAAELSLELVRYLEGRPIIARPPGPVERGFRLIRRRPTTFALATCILALAALLGAVHLRSQMKQRQLQAEALVETITTADSRALPRLVDRAEAEKDAVLPLVKQKLQSVAETNQEWFNLQVADMSVDPSATGAELFAYLPSATPGQIDLLVSTLATRREAMRVLVWKALADPNLSDMGRLQLACLAAQVSAEDPRWNQISAPVVGALVRQHPLDLGPFARALEPVGNELIPQLLSRFRDPHEDLLARDFAASILARFAADDPSTLVELLVESNASSFHLVWPSIEQQAAAAIPQLKAIAAEQGSFEQLAANSRWQTIPNFERTFDDGQRRRAHALVALWRLGDADLALKSLHGDGDPALRSWLIELLVPLGIPPTELWACLKAAMDPGTRQALVLALGQVSQKNVETDNKSKWVSGLLQLYRTDSDAGVHAACRWALRERWQGAALIEEADRDLRGSLLPERNWYSGPNGHTFVALRGRRTFEMGSPPSEGLREPDEALHDVELPRGFAIAMEEVTIAQFLKFRQKYFHRQYSPTDECPANNISWYEAAAYCRWLSELEKFPEEEMCYPAVEEIKPGMTLPRDWHKRSAYRLPTEAEWEYACRAMVPFSRFCGEGAEMPLHYMRFLKNSENHAWPVGTLKPNGFGLFDMSGNVAERCHDVYALYPDAGNVAVRDLSGESDLKIDAGSMRVFRGGNFGDIDAGLRSARRGANAPGEQWALIGFRPIRTLPMP